MAKPIRIAGLSRRTPIARAASKVLRATLQDLLEKVPDARSGDPDKWIEDLNDALGEVRDRDVALGQLRKLTAGPAEPSGSVARLRARLEAERLASVAALAAMLDRLQLEGVPARLAASIESLEQQAAPGRPTHEFARE